MSPILGTLASQNTKSFLTIPVDYLVVAGGGGGASRNNGNPAGVGGLGGGGQAGTAGGVNTGGGGYSDFVGTAGSGIVIIRALRAAASTVGSPVYTTSGSYHIYKFNDSGSITF